MQPPYRHFNYTGFWGFPQGMGKGSGMKKKAARERVFQAARLLDSLIR
jgi:hypothetical protein